MTIAIDLDGCLAQSVEPYDQMVIGDPVPGAVDVLRVWLAAGHEVIIHTCRAQRGKYLDEAWDHGQRIRLVGEWLKAQGLGAVSIWTENGKPHADLYLDDRAFQVSERDPDAWAKAENAVRLLARAAMEVQS